MKNLYKILISTLFITTFGFAQTDVSGTISSNTTWDVSGSPYTVTGNTTLLSDVTLSIDQGVEVSIIPNINFLIMGKILAIGVENDSIFISSSTNQNWSGFTFPASYSDTSDFEYVVFSNSNQLFELLGNSTGGINLLNSRLSGITNVFYNESGSYTDIAVLINNCKIISCNNPLNFGLARTTIVTNNIFHN